MASNHAIGTAAKLKWSILLTVVTAGATLAAWWAIRYPVPLLWITACSVLTATAFWYDKVVSKRQRPALRVPETSLLWMCLIGGSPGGLLSMLSRRHKTVDPGFKFRLGIILGLQIAAVLGYVFWRLTSGSGGGPAS